MTETPGTAIVTGAGAGLGRALAVELCARGLTVAGIGRTAAGLAETADLSGTRFHAITADVADPAQVRDAFARIAAIAPPAILINNAAVYPRRDILDETPETFMATVATNLGGTVNCTLAALDHFTATGQGRILNVATFADLAPIPASSAYAVSKGAARILTRAMCADLADRFPRIVISDWMPGMLATRMGIAEGLDPATAARWGATLAMMTDPTLNGTTWEMHREIPPPQSLKRRMLDRLTGRRVRARQL
jgi:NAD(P)-dependent dehydrogenase (short-subunit alcohol dehydrogenase family)